MLIVSDFHDYYDSAHAYGIDKQVVYRRVTKNIPWEHKFMTWAERKQCPAPFEQLIGALVVRKFVIGFCGHMHPIIHIQSDIGGQHCFYDAHSLGIYLGQSEMKADPKLRFGFYSDYDVKSKKDTQEFFNPHNWDKLLGKFQEYKCPVFMYGRTEDKAPSLVLNPVLKHYRFQKVKDPVSAFQDIHMYISGVLGVEHRPTVSISDKDKQAAKGHDGPYSFKKPPGGGRWR